jgi:hypothetical protein
MSYYVYAKGKKTLYDNSLFFNKRLLRNAVCGGSGSGSGKNSF